MTFDHIKAQRDLDDWMEMDPRDAPVPAGVVLTEHMQAALDEITRQREEIKALRKKKTYSHLLDQNNQQAKRIAELEELDKCLNCGRHLFSFNPILGMDSVYRLGVIFFDPGSPGGREEPPEPSCAIPVCQDCLEDLEKVDLLKEKITKQRAALKKLAAKYRKTNTDLKAFKSVARDLNCDLTRKAILADKRLDALKILGQRSAKRGKALVEERAASEYSDFIPHQCRFWDIDEEPFCRELDGPCEYRDGKCPIASEIRQIARQQLRQEGIL